jgi:hypothetical protein
MIALFTGFGLDGPPPTTKAALLEMAQGRPGFPRWTPRPAI